MRRCCGTIHRFDHQLKDRFFAALPVASDVKSGVDTGPISRCARHLGGGDPNGIWRQTFRRS
jgi:hypothetical protein